MNEAWIRQFGEYKKRSPIGDIRTCIYCPNIFDAYSSRQKRCHTCCVTGRKSYIHVKKTIIREIKNYKYIYIEDGKRMYLTFTKYGTMGFRYN